MLLICGALERRWPETVPGTLTRSITLDIVDMSTMGREYTEVCEFRVSLVQSLFTESEMSSLYESSVAVQPCFALDLAWSETTKTGLLMTRIIHQYGSRGSY